ncbi:chemotaxis response regulator protein-glutamate methylesterase [Colwellia sp. D2M02]|uniref:protein-glutamate methylesterase/protein-glutamine glutaminase n=1 Tax=Colwellia sp. D2M02 TaxID=2841562 RepID=UPI001C0A192B|nr:chemotaxis response regulator protein-glutamate methylesterase [Colwellia sp. D2M02]MBU2893214.1 chemotaxis response regulator protein-glutamate methylesterase [Colwellia sp. D2M02]
MAYKVLVVDDSSFFRRRVTDILTKDPQLEVIGVAVNGQEAVDKAKLLKPDVITMDIEMPVLNGIDAVKKIMSQSPTAILMFSSLTHQGAKATLEALEAGALDFLPKKFSEIAKNTDEAGSLLRQRVLEIARKPNLRARVSKPTPPVRSDRPLTREVPTKIVERKEVGTSVKKSSNTISRSSGKEYKLLAIGTSTGGPVALQKILTQFNADFPLPIVMVQHMPAAFTAAFASRLDSLCKIKVKEAADGDVLKPGCAYLAPGGRQMIISGTESAAKIKILEDDSPKITFKPSVDITFGSAAKTFSGKVLAVILTGMGSDGKEGARMLKTKGATIWSQDEQSCVVYGMPQAIDKAGISQLSLPLDAMAPSMVKEVSRG